MPVINPAVMKFIMLLLGSLLVLSPISFMDNQEVTVRDRIGHYEVIIPTKDDEKTHIVINRHGTTWGREQIVPFDGIAIFDKGGRFVQEFNPLENIDNPDLVRDNFAKFFEQLPKDKVEAIAPWLEKAVRDYDGLLKELEKKAEKE